MYITYEGVTLGNEYWEARELLYILGYIDWRKFNNTIQKAKTVCSKSKLEEEYHFVGADKMITIAKGGKRKIPDYKLSRYACYLIAQNSVPRKEIVALAQTYFAIQTKRIELFEKEYESLSENDKRLYQRNLTKKGNNSTI